jgi:hypothetical protein
MSSLIVQDARNRGNELDSSLNGEQKIATKLQRFISSWIDFVVGRSQAYDF